ncbi:unnamed protein product [Leptidea sinapis]|uniref:Uncharacterized protein n=1 Tax=Leptidea sinapis TaxID=189913 RepID=A0A5E4Q783_9NEOP|nr:unnamed protein product [Leptidea sinapis]
MDVYGYRAYQHNQSDELAKQMFVPQPINVMSFPNTANRDIPEPHTMPAPSGIPWNTQDLSWSMQSPPNLVQFTGEMPFEQKPNFHCKRKSNDMEPVIPPKQLITEEKMAEHLSSLHISSSYTQHSLASEDVMEVSFEQPSISDRLKGHTIVLSEDIKKIKEEPLLPPSLIDTIPNPQMSLVVWKPIEEIIKIKPEDMKEEETMRRNGVLVAVDANGMEIEM